MRHIPEDELHAYLDQALSRSQCVEIESHLAACVACRRERDAIAALRDRTTALLAQLAPTARRAPGWASLQAEAGRRAATRRHRFVRLGWAASLAAAVGLGWIARDLTPSVGTPPPGPVAATPSLPSDDAPRATLPSAPVTAAAPAATDRADAEQAPPAPGPLVAATPVVPSFTGELEPAVVPPPSGMALRSVSAIDKPGELALDGIWRTLSWDRLQRDTTTWVPHVEGLPVTGVQASRTGASGITVVAQQLASGETIRTVAGPAADVSTLLSRGGHQSTSALLEPVPSAGAPAAMALDASGGRMLAVFGPVSSDSLRAYLMRVK